MSLDSPSSFVVGVSPFERPDARLIAAVSRAGALGVIDLGRDIDLARQAVSDLLGMGVLEFGVRVPEASPLMPEHLSTDPPFVLLGDAGTGEDLEIWKAPGRKVFVEVRSLEEARRAIGFGADGLVLKGSESGGRVGEESSLILLSRVARNVNVALWVAGGIGIHSAPGAIVGGAERVVLDSQLALVRESSIPASIRTAVGSMDGSETAVICGYRVLMRPGLKSCEVVGESDPDVIRGLIGGDDLKDRLLPVGQDGAFARIMARRWLSAGGVVTGIDHQIEEHLSAAGQSRPLAPGSSLAIEHNTKYPIAQGPMTRVSDKAAFALEVARGGALPFIALSLMTGQESRTLLQETAEMLQEMPWGVGILGFVPPEIRAQQLEVIHDIAPSVALIAGGRPSQAKPLEEVGITTYLHVPSPGLLEMFIKDGARHFVFEGRECGGHVGPRSSFVLWDSQVETILRSGLASEVSVLFAGGIHDATTAGIVAGVAGTLAEAGGSIGVLMGTAYLFTEEAVSAGAIKPGFQAEAIGCESTVLLETAPGHATRCADTEYVRAFSAERERLEAGGLDQNEVWAALEVFNLGRLRIASKGLVREVEGIVEVPEEIQKREGMYMIGQVAALRNEPTDISSLHEDVSVGSVVKVSEANALNGEAFRRSKRSIRNQCDVAIIGMACVLPGAPDKETYWANIVAGKDAISEVPPERWDIEQYYDPEAVSVDAGKKTPSKWGGFIPYTPFDALEYGIPPRSLAAIEPVQLLSLQVAADALRDAGYAHDGEREFNRDKVSVVFGAEAGTDLASAYGFRSLAPQYLGGLPNHLEELLPELTEDSFPGLLTNVIAGRIANRLDLGGLNYTVDAACASSIAALDAGVKELTSGSSEMVLCGGADLHNGINDYLLFSAVHALSPKGRCLSFDAQADGISLGEGVACVVLKRLEDAQRDGDRIYAVVRGIGGSSDGRSLGLTAPRPKGQRIALERAYESAGINPCEVGLLEAHGTGTVVGDRTELGVLTDVFSSSNTSAGSCVLGSVKSQIGHTKCAAGLASIIKVAMALHHRVLPPTVNLTEPNDGYERSTSPFKFNLAARPWACEKRTAGVSAFGFGGTNFHAVLESLPPATIGGDSAGGRIDTAVDLLDGDSIFGSEVWPEELFVFRGLPSEVLSSLKMTLEYANAVKRSLSARGELGKDAISELLPRGGIFRDLAASVCEAGNGDALVTMVASNFEDLVEKLALAIGAMEPDEKASADATETSGIKHAGLGVGDEQPTVAKTETFYGPLEISDCVYMRTGPPGNTGPQGNDVHTLDRPKVAFLFPGQGSQKPGMLSELLVTFTGPSKVLSKAQRWIDHLAPSGAFTPEQRKAQEAAITDTRVAQPVMGIAGVFMSDLLRTVGVSPDLSGGHSYGELVALATSGAIPRDRLLDLSERRAEVILEAAGADPGAMAAVVGDLEQVRSAIGAFPDVVVANDNSPSQVVISGSTEAVERAMAELSGVGLRAKRLPVACAFHSPVVSSAVDAFSNELAKINVQPCRHTVFSNVTAAAFPDDEHEMRQLVATQLGSSVRFREQVEAMYEMGARVFVECGPGRVLTGLVDRILDGKSYVAIAGDGSGRGDLKGFLKSLARLAACGVLVDEKSLFRGRANVFDLTSPPTLEVRWLVNGHLVRDGSGQVLNGALQPATAFSHALENRGADAHVLSRDDRALNAGFHLSTSNSQGALALDPTAIPGRVVRNDNNVAQRVVEPGREQLAVEYLRSLREVVAAGKEVMLGLIGSSPPPALQVDHVRSESKEHYEPGNQITDGSNGNAGSVASRSTQISNTEADRGEASDQRTSSSDKALGKNEVRERVLWVVSERTGYPLEMLEGSLDLEADLSIDSIKRLEIVGELADRVGLVGSPDSDSSDIDDSVIEELVEIKTLDGIVDWILEATSSRTDLADTSDYSPAELEAGQESSDSDNTGNRVTADDAKEDGDTTVPAVSSNRVDSSMSEAVTRDARDGLEVPDRGIRMVEKLVALEICQESVFPASYAGKRIAITDDGTGIGSVLNEELTAVGASVEMVNDESTLDAVDIFIHLEALNPWSDRCAVRMFDYWKKASKAGASRLVAVTAIDSVLGQSASEVGAGPGFGSSSSDSELLRFAGMRGIAKTFARELSDISSQLVDIAPGTGACEAARIIAQEIIQNDGFVEVGRSASVRVTSEVVEQEVMAVGSGDDLLGLDENSVVVITGGARGIGSRVAKSLASRVRGIRVVLVGRTVMPLAPEDPSTANCKDARELRRTLAETGYGALSAIEDKVRRLLAERELRETVETIRASGAKVEYRCADIASTESSVEVIEGVYRDHGRIDGLIHAAGVLEDAKISDKSVESFERVFDTKCSLPLVLEKLLRPGVKFVVMFSSIAGVFGNAGQVDYACANDALRSIARYLNGRVPGKVVAISWGPWAGGGMVSPELEREFERRGIGLLEPEDGVSRVFSELSSDSQYPEVVVVRAVPERFLMPSVPSPR